MLFPSLGVSLSYLAFEEELSLSKPKEFRVFEVVVVLVSENRVGKQS